MIYIAAIFGVVIFLLGFNLQSNYHISSSQSVIAKSLANNFLLYRQSVQHYKLYNNLTSNSTIPTTNLSFPTGYVEQNLWTNEIYNGVLYIYSKSANVYPELPAQIKLGLGNSIFAGLGTADHHLIAVANNIKVSLDIPTDIPAGSVVVIGE